MITMTWSNAPADLLGLGGLDVRPAYGPGPCSGRAERTVAPFAPAQGTGLSAVGTAVRPRPVIGRVIGHDVIAQSGVITQSFENNGTTLGIHSSGGPQS
jgi:hypothetical protein